MKKACHMDRDELKQELAKVNNLIEYLEDKQGFAPRKLKERFHELNDELKARELRDAAMDSYVSTFGTASE